MHINATVITSWKAKICTVETWSTIRTGFWLFFSSVDSDTRNRSFEWSDQSGNWNPCVFIGSWYSWLLAHGKYTAPCGLLLQNLLKFSFVFLQRGQGDGGYQGPIRGRQRVSIFGINLTGPCFNAAVCLLIIYLLY